MINFRSNADMFHLFVLNAKREPMRAPEKFHALPRVRDYSAYQSPAYLRPRDAERTKIDRARKVPDMPVPPMLLRRQAD